jgi:hypothetical protein
MRHRPIREFGYATAVVFLLSAAYFGAYIALVRRGTESIFDPAKDGLVQPNYQVENYWAPAFFGPAHAIDRQLRCGYWSDNALLEVLREGHPIPPRRPWGAQIVRE